MSRVNWRYFDKVVRMSAVYNGHCVAPNVYLWCYCLFTFLTRQSFDCQGMISQNTGVCMCTRGTHSWITPLYAYTHVYTAWYIIGIKQHIHQKNNQQNICNTVITACEIAKCYFTRRFTSPRSVQYTQKHFRYTWHLLYVIRQLSGPLRYNRYICQILWQLVFITHEWHMLN